MEVEKTEEAQARERRARARAEATGHRALGLVADLFSLAPEVREAFLRLVRGILPKNEHDPLSDFLWVSVPLFLFLQ